ncbi:MAG: hypothetical protein KJP15_11300 [Gammaproteobacteria bacterium]|nr:hypothetical protein [Gammaproteobacteria bacterium]
MALPTSGNAVDMRVAAEIMHFDYEETDTLGNTLNQETGYLPGLSLAASHPYRSTFNTLEFSIYDGQVDYDGRTQSGQPHQTTTEQSILRLLYRLSWSPQGTKGALYGKIYWQQWDRDIQPANSVLGLFERYRWWTLEAGVQVPFIKDKRRNLLFEFGALATTNGTIMIDLADLGFGSPTLDLGDDYGFSGKLKYEVLHSSNSSFQFGLQFRRWEFGRSNSKTVSDGSTSIVITEPDSTSMQTTLSAGYRYRF